MILVAGASGSLGGLITRQLLEKGEQVRVLARPTSQVSALVDAGAQRVIGDLKDRASLDAAVNGADVVITTATASQRGGDDTLESVDRQGTRNLIDAAAQAGVHQFIYVSAIGADPASPHELSRAKGENEQALRSSGMPFTIIEANIFMEIWIGAVVGMPLQQGWPVTLIGTAERKHSFISVADVAAFTVASVGHPSAINQKLPIGGPEAVSWKDIVAAVGRVIGRDIPVNLIGYGESIPGLPPVFTNLMTYGDTFDTIMPMEEMARTFGVQQTSLDMYVQRTFGAPAP